MSCAADLERNHSLAEAQIQEIERVVVWVDKILEEGQRGKSVSPHLWMLAFRLCDPESEMAGHWRGVGNFAVNPHGGIAKDRPLQQVLSCPL